MSDATLGRLRDALGRYDGRTTDDLLAIEAQLGAEAGYHDALVAMVAMTGTDAGNTANGAIWLIKRTLENGATLNASQIAGLIESLPGQSDWAAQLHLAQSLRWLDLPQRRAGEVADWLTRLLAHKRPFVRAWALDGMAHLARTLDGFEADYAQALAQALDDDAASVRARARKLAGGGR